MLFEDETISIYEGNASGVPHVMRTDIQEKDGNYLLEIELPGYKHEDIQAELTNGLLTIIAKKNENLEKKETQVNYIRRERLVNGCKRSFYVGNNVAQDDISAAFCDGILSVLIVNHEKSVEREEIKLIPIKNGNKQE